MKTTTSTALAALAVLATSVLTATTGHADDVRTRQVANASQNVTKPRPEPNGSSAGAAVQVPLSQFRPPLRGAPGGRIGGSRGIRGGGALYALAPDELGFTALEQPVLHWFTESVPEHPVELTVVDLRSGQAVLDTELPRPARAGVLRINLSDHGVRLEAGVPYRWFVAVVIDPDRRSKDLLVGGTIERRHLDDAVAARVARAADADRPALYLAAGLWYDAMATVLEAIEARPGDSALLHQRSALLSDSGLPTPID